jgi:predicted flap endonuclease-1-like 5' DNA nuclease
MTALTWQTLLLLTVAYFAGCCLGCILRRIFGRPRVEAIEPISQPVVAVRPQAEGASLSRSGEPVRRAEPIAPAVAAVTERNMDGASGTAGKETSRSEHALSGDTRPSDRQPIPAPVATPIARVDEKAAVAAPDDLKRIHLINAAVESRLNAVGVRRFGEIAQWTASDVARISKELGFKGRIQNENWIEQAQILAKGGETHYARRLARGETVAAQLVKDEGKPSVVSVPEEGSGSDSKPDVASRSAFAASEEQAPGKEDRPAPVAQRDAAAPARSLPVGMARDNLQRIRGINAEIEELIGLQGVTRYTQIASWAKSDVERFDRLLGQDGRIARENWIEQAQILAKGGDTAYSLDLERRPAASDESGATPARTTDLSGLRSVRSEALRATDTPSKIEAGSSRRIGLAGDLKRIRGIGVLIEKRLHSLGVTSYEHIANWTASDIDRISQTLDFKGRIERENWVEQARILAAGGQTEFSRRFDRSGGQI